LSLFLKYLHSVLENIIPFPCPCPHLAPLLFTAASQVVAAVLLPLSLFSSLAFFVIAGLIPNASFSAEMILFFLVG